MRFKVLALLLMSGVASAEPANVVEADLGLHVVGAGIQRTVAPKVALQLDLDYYSPWTQMLADGHSGTVMSGAVVRARAFWFFDRAPSGWWVSPFVQAGVAKGTSSGAVAAGGASIGYTWLVGKLAIALGVGAQYHYAGAEPGFSGVWPHGDINVGYAF